MSRARDILKNSIFQASGKIAGIGFGIMSFALMSRYLGPSDFGAYTTAFTFVSVFATLADLGLPVMLLRLLAMRNKKDNSDIANLNTIRLISTILILGAGVLIGRLLPYDATIQEGILIVTVGFLAVSFTQYLVVVFQERLKTGRFAIAEVLGRAIMFVVVFLAVRYDLGLATVFWGATLGSVAALILTAIFSKRLWKFRLASDLDTWPKLVKIATPLMLLTVFSLIYFKIDTLLLSLIKGNVDVGIYGAAYKYMDVFVTFPAFFSQLVIPFFARAISGKNTDYLISIFTRSLRAVAVASLPLALITFFEADRLVELFSGAEFAISADVLQILSLAVVPLFVGNLTTAVLIGTNRAAVVAWLFGGAAVVGVAAYYFAIQNYTYFGAATVTVVVETFIATAALIAVIYVARKIPNLFFVIPLIISGLVFALMLVLLGNLNLFLTLSIASIFYGATLLLTRTIKLNELRDLIGLRTR